MSLFMLYIVYWNFYNKIQLPFIITRYVQLFRLIEAYQMFEYIAEIKIIVVENGFSVVSNYFAQRFWFKYLSICYVEESIKIIRDFYLVDNVLHEFFFASFKHYLNAFINKM